MISHWTSNIELHLMLINMIDLTIINVNGAIIQCKQSWLAGQPAFLRAATDSDS